MAILGLNEDSFVEEEAQEELTNEGKNPVDDGGINRRIWDIKFSVSYSGVVDNSEQIEANNDELERLKEELERLKKIKEELELELIEWETKLMLLLARVKLMKER